jgi:hypothetical protein
VSRARKTPIIPTSRTRNEIMYSLIRVWIGLKLARIEIHDRVVVRTTSATTARRPELVLDAEDRDPVDGLDELEARPRQVADEQEEREDPRHSAKPSATGAPSVAGAMATTSARRAAGR